MGAYSINKNPHMMSYLPLNQRFDLILKSPRRTVKKGSFAVTASMFNSKLLANDSNSVHTKTKNELKRVERAGTTKNELESPRSSWKQQERVRTRWS